jgi:hypothetical protein
MYLRRWPPSLRSSRQGSRAYQPLRFARARVGASSPNDLRASWDSNLDAGRIEPGQESLRGPREPGASARSAPGSPYTLLPGAGRFARARVGASSPNDLCASGDWTSTEARSSDGRFGVSRPSREPGRIAAIRAGLSLRSGALQHQSGVPARELAERAGHARPSVSLDVYSHILPPDEIPAERLEALIRP